MFGKKPDERGQMRENTRELRKAQRGLDTDRRQLEQREKQLETEIRKLAKQGQREACTVLAKQLVELRRQKTKMVNVGAMISGTQAKSSQITAMGTMGRAMASSAKALGQANAQLPVAQFQRQMDDFARQNALMDMREEVISETLDSILDTDEGEEDRVVAQVLDEIGLEMGEKLSGAPRAVAGTIGERQPALGSKIGGGQKAPLSAGGNSSLPASKNGSGMDDAELERMLAELTGGKN